MADDGAIPSSKDECTPILGAVAYPAHLLYVPPPLWGVAFGIASFFGAVVGIITDSGMRTEVVFAIVIPLIILFGILYRKDKFVWKRWKTRFFDGKPFPPFRVTKNLCPQSSVNRFI